MSYKLAVAVKYVFNSIIKWLHVIRGPLENRTAYMYRSSFSDHSFVFWMLVYTKLPGTDLNIVLSKLHYQSMYVNLCDLQRFAMESIMTSVIPHKVA